MDARKVLSVKYSGEGQFIPGVPARDLTVQEWAVLPHAVQAVCLSTGVYEIVAEEPKSRRVRTPTKRSPARCTSTITRSRGKKR